MPAFARKRLSIGIGVATLAILASVLALVLVVPREATAAGAKHNVIRYVENGDWADLYASRDEAVPGNPDSACWYSVHVGRGGSSMAPATYLYYDISAWDPNLEWYDKEDQVHYGGCATTVGGGGTIPDSAYKVSSRTQTLIADTSTVPGFEFWEGSDGGLISVVWEKSGLYESRSSGGSWSRWPSGSSSRGGTSGYSSAKATGTVQGIVVASPESGENGAIGWSSAVNVCRSTDPDACYYGGK